MTDYNELKRLALAATTGPWLVNGKQSIRGVNGEYIAKSNWNNGIENSAFISAANPSAVLALIAENERLKRDAECAAAKQAHAEMIGDGFYLASEKLKVDLAELTEKYEAARDRKNSITALQVENERLQEELEMGRDDLLIFKSAVSALGEESKKLVFCARTSGGSAGADQGLIDACVAVEGVITIGGVVRAMTYVEELKAEVEVLRKDLESHKRMLLRSACGLGAIGEALGAEMDDDASELEGIAAELRKDARRYRWLLVSCQDTADELSVSGQLYFGTYAAGKLSEAIDAAMSKEISHDQ